MDRKQHWEKVYGNRPANRLGWYRQHLETSLAWIDELGLPPDAPIIDVGGGASTLVDDLLDRGFADLTVLDVSGAALTVAQERLGPRATRVSWVEGDITTVGLPAQRFALWHDRAVFHFLVTPDDRASYRERLLDALRPDGHVIIGVFAPDAPPTCSGLPVQRYRPEDLLATLGPGWVLVRSERQLHVTPGGVEQMYQYCQLRRETAGVGAQADYPA